jgi:hypothetical protein
MEMGTARVDTKDKVSKVASQELKREQPMYEKLNSICAGRVPVVK